MLRQGPLTVTLRPVRLDDAPSLISIYAPHVTDGVVSFEEVVPTLAEFEQRIRDYSKVAPWLVAERDGEIVGFAYASRHRERAAYRWTVEVSIYTASHCHRRGVGRLLYGELLTSLRMIGYCSALAGITVPNPQSVQFHEALGFRPVALYRAIGYKHGAWRDVGWWQLILNEPGANPPREPHLS